MYDYLNSNPGQLLQEAREHGDLNSLLQLYRSYMKMLARLELGSQLSGKFDASDVVQEVFLKATCRFGQFRGRSEQEFLAWLRQILATVLANMVRRFQGTQRRNVRLEEDLDRRLGDASSVMQMALVDASPSPSEQIAGKERAVLLAEALEQLPADYRELIVLRHLEQLTFPEISQRMGRSVDSVKNIWPRALARLKRIMRDEP